MCSHRIDPASAIPLLEQAIKLDPNFAEAYALLAAAYADLGENDLGSENTRKAFALREHVSAREKLSIDYDYYVSVTGNLEKARQTSVLCSQTYPRDSKPNNGLGYVYYLLGQYDQAILQ